MLTDLLLPKDCQLSIDSITPYDRKLVIEVSSTQSTAVCPDCGTLAHRVHGRYRRQPADLPLGGDTVVLHLLVRRFCCDNPVCQRTTFSERIPTVLRPYAHRTDRLKTIQRQVAFDLGGEPGSRLLAQLGMPASGDTLLRLIRATPEPKILSPRVLGVDDWAKRKGHSYGTILVDLENRQVVDLLPDRTAESLASWLRSHPGVEIISRDRSGEYAKGASDGAPDAIEVADRWHLLENLRTHLQLLLSQKPKCLEAAAMTDTEKNTTPVDDSSSQQNPPSDETAQTPPNVPKVCTQTTGNCAGQVSLTPTTQEAPASDAWIHQEEAEPLPQQRQPVPDNRLKRRYQAVKELHSLGANKAEIARQLKIDPRTIRKYISADSCPTYSPRPRRRSKLDGYKGVIKKRWEAGDNATQIFSHLRQLGYFGGRSIVMDYIKNTFRGSGRRRDRCSGQTTAIEAGVQSTATVEHLPVIPWSARQASWLLAKPAEDLSKEEMGVLSRMQRADEAVGVAHTLAQRFVQMIRQRQPEALLPWLKEIKACSLDAFSRFATGIERDLSAVTHALSLPWSQGQTEGQVTRLKLIKRQMYGRANFDLLRKRVLGCPAPG